MSYPKPSAQEEAAFMIDLLSGLDDSFFNAVPSPDPSPQKSTHRVVSSSGHTVSSLVEPKLSIQYPTKSLLYTVPEMPAHKPNAHDPYSMGVNQSKGAPVKLNTVAKVKVEDVDMAALLDGAEEWDWNDMNDDFMSPKKLKPKTKQKSDRPDKRTPIREYEAFVRCVIEVITDGASEKRLDVRVESDKVKRIVILRDDWVTTDARVGDIANVIGLFEMDGVIPTITISSKRNLFILHPDLLLTATSISNAPQCVRRPLISSLIRSTSDTTPALVWGNLLHEVMQRCLSAQRWDELFVQELIDEAIKKSLAELVKIGVNVEQARKEVNSRAKGLNAFSKRFIGSVPKLDAVLSNTRSTQGTTSLLAITHLHDVEEDIWSPKYGIKGKIDASVQGLIEERNALTRTQASWTLPFEIKTGRAVAGMEHRAQTMLYTLLMEERYGVDVPSGLLYYTQSDEVIRVPAGWNEVRSLVVARNEMAGYMMRRLKSRGTQERKDEDKDVKIGDFEAAGHTDSFLPPTIDEARICSKCYAVDACMLFRKAVENVVDETSPIADLYELKTSHLTPPQTSFFKKWEELISLEEQDLVRFRKELWTMGAKQREEKGRCLSSMILDISYRAPDLKLPGSKDAKIHQFTYKFIRQNAHRQDGFVKTDSLLNGHILVGDPITVSVEPHLLAFARGFVLELTPEEIVIGVDHVITEEFVFARSPNLVRSTQIVFRIDKDELAGGMARVRDNLAQLFYANGDKKRLELIVDLKAPTFDASKAADATEIVNTLNVNQRQAMAKAISANDYALILGMPGTGKTTTIAEIIRALVAQGKSVLLTSYTHSAVDTILLKLKNMGDFGILRLGNIDKVHPDIHQFTLSVQRMATTFEQLEHQILRPPVVATTCLSIDHAVFSRRTFDYCIVDEASQITLPTCVGPLRFADKFILVGDHFQLPPLVRSRGARKGGLDVSLFRRLSDAHPHAVVDLAYQYRMNEDIMLLSNKLIYGDRLKSGSKEVAERTLKIPNRTCVDSMHGSDSCGKRCWMQRLMDESCKAVFLDTDALPAKDSRVGDLVQNEVEASLVYQITETLLVGGVREEQLGIISLYRQQIKLLSHMLQDHKQIEILTADRSQGRDKDCIIISLVRSNDSGQVGDLLKDWRRMNVAFTRARAKLIIIGSRKTLQAAPVLSEFFSLMDTKRWILSLSPGADTLHSIASPKRTAVKRMASEDDIHAEESLVLIPQKKIKKAKVEGGLLRNRPVLKDLFNDAQR